MNKSKELASASEKTIKQSFGKRNSNYPLEYGIASKKQKVLSESAISSTTKNYNSSLSENSLKRMSMNPLTTKPKFTSTAIAMKASKSLSNPINNQSTKSKPRFTENSLSNSLHSNLRRILEEEKHLDNNLKKLTSSNEDTKIKVLNEFGKKNLELLELEGLTKMLHSFKKSNEDKKSCLREINAKSIAIKESVENSLEKSRKVIEQLKTKNIHLVSKIQIKHADTIMDESKHTTLIDKEKELGNMKTNISFDTMKTEEDVKIAERKHKISNQQLQKVSAKKEEYYKNKIESMSQILVLKPFYKKFCVIRNVVDQLPKDRRNKPLTDCSPSISTFPSQNIKIQKNRKTLQLLNEDVQFKFDYIATLLDNPYEEINYTKENNFLNEELVTIFMSYLIKMSQSSDERNLVVLYVSDQLNSSSNLFPILLEIGNKISHYNDYSFSIKIAQNKEFKEVSKEIIFNHNNKLNINLKDVEKAANNFKAVDEIIYYFSIQNKQNNSNLKIINVSCENVNIATQLLSNMNEINSKRKKERSSKKRKTGRDILYILEQMEITNAFFYMTVLDTNYGKLFPKIEENIKEILFNIN